MTNVVAAEDPRLLRASRYCSPMVRGSAGRYSRTTRTDSPRRTTEASTIRMRTLNTTVTGSPPGGKGGDTGQVEAGMDHLEDEAGQTKHEEEESDVGINQPVEDPFARGRADRHH